MLAPTKCESSWLTIENKDAAYKPNINLSGTKLQVNRYPNFLGVKFDRLLRFTEHAKYVTEKAQRRLNVLARLSGTTWGAQDEDL